MESQPIPPANPVTYQQAPTPLQQPQSLTEPLGMFSRRMSRLAFLLSTVYCLAPLVVAALLQFILQSILNRLIYSTTSVTTLSTTPNALIDALNVIIIVIIIAAVLLIFPVKVSAYVRRLHDLNQSGWLTLLILVPFVGIPLFLYLLFAPGTREQNKYGAPVSSLRYLVVLGFKRPS
ncbi:MAG TPA: DUF805 domain-containing protein [Verrucomicrobiae bacterium]|nr:DUF805 domain-containing protein [Verrucomicrobiae bacterium]